MNLEKIGNFIKQLRIENKLTQQQLADKIPITREAVSKWERGKNKPDKYTLEILSKLFNVTTEELILGRRNELHNSEENKQLALTLYDENNKKQKKLKILFIIIFIILILFFIYYFFVNFNSIKIYTIKYDQDGIVVKNGIFVSTREKFYFNFSDIICPEKITGLKLYYKDNEEEKIIYETKGSIIILYDYYEYDAYFKYEELDTVLNNLYIKIICEENEYNIKLNVKKDFANNKLFFKDKKDLLNENNIIYNQNFEIKTEKIESKFTNKNEYYISINNNENIVFYYFDEINLLTMILNKDKNNIMEWNYFIKIKRLEFKEYKNSLVINYYFLENNDLNCLIGDCNKSNEIINYFFDKLNMIINS